MVRMFVVALACVLSVPVIADDNIDASKLVGQWVPKQVPEKLAPKFGKTFTDDGKFVQGGIEPGSLALKGTYTLEGAKLTTKFDDVPGVPGEVLKYTVKKLTDKELTLLQGKKSETYRRLK